MTLRPHEPYWEWAKLKIRQAILTDNSAGYDVMQEFYSLDWRIQSVTL